MLNHLIVNPYNAFVSLATDAPITTAILIGAGTIYLLNKICKIKSAPSFIEKTISFTPVNAQKLPPPTLLTPQEFDVQASPLLNLPLEITCLIASYLNPRDVIKLTSTHSSLFKNRFEIKQLQKLSFASYLEELQIFLSCVSVDDPLLSLQRRIRLPEDFKSIQKLSLSVQHDVSEQIQNLSKFLPNIAHLDLNLTLDSALCKSIFKALSHFPKLQTLIIRDCINLTTLPAEIGQLQQLRTLEISYCINLTHLPAEIGQLIKQLRIHQLKHSI